MPKECPLTPDYLQEENGESNDTMDDQGEKPPNEQDAALDKAKRDLQAELDVVIQVFAILEEANVLYLDGEVNGVTDEGIQERTRHHHIMRAIQVRFREAGESVVFQFDPSIANAETGEVARLTRRLGYWRRRLQGLCDDIGMEGPGHALTFFLNTLMEQGW